VLSETVDAQSTVSPLQGASLQNEHLEAQNHEDCQHPGGSESPVCDRAEKVSSPRREKGSLKIQTDLNSLSND